MKRRALKTIFDWVSSKLSTAPIEEQIKVYEALGHVLPSEDQRRRATEIAVSLSEVAKLQLDFTRILFSGLNQSKSRHRGDGGDGE